MLLCVQSQISGDLDVMCQVCLHLLFSELISLTGPCLSVLGKRLGKSMGVVSKEVKAMSTEDIIAFEKAGEITVASHTLKLSDIKVNMIFDSLYSVLSNSSYLSVATRERVNQVCSGFSFVGYTETGDKGRLGQLPVRTRNGGKSGN